MPWTSGWSGETLADLGLEIEVQIHIKCQKIRNKYNSLLTFLAEFSYLLLWYPSFPYHFFLIALFMLSSLHYESESEVAQSCPTLCDPIDCSLPGSSDHGIFQAIVPEWVAISFFRWSSQPRARTWVSRIVDRRSTVWATREVNFL